MNSIQQSINPAALPPAASDHETPYADHATPDTLPAPTEHETRDTEHHARRTRTGKVARLPRDTRDQINHMLDDGLPYLDIIQRLGDLGADLNEDCLTSWKAGGYQDWLREQQCLEVWRQKWEFALRLVRENKGTVINEATQQILATQICEIITEIGPDSLRAALERNPETYLRLVSALPRITSAQLRCDRHHIQEAERLAALENEQPDNAPKVIRPQTIKKIESGLNLL